MKTINLTRGMSTVVDDDDYEYLMQWKWLYHRSGYAIRMVYNKITKGYNTVYMHRIINNTPDGYFTDHIDGDKLNNQSLNLRTATNRQNLQNTSAHKNSSTGLKGVSFSKKRNKFYSQIRIEGRRIHLGFFDTPEQAKESYDKTAKQYHGEFSKK